MINNGGTILIVDDNRLEVLITKKSFKKLGLRTELVHVEDGEEAINYLSSGKRPSIILLDINMPKMNGLEFLKKRNENSTWRSIPVIVFSSSKPKENLKAAFRLGISGYMVKPIDFEEMTELLRAIVNYWSHSEHAEIA